MFELCLYQQKEPRVLIAQSNEPRRL